MRTAARGWLSLLVVLGVPLSLAWPPSAMGQPLADAAREQRWADEIVPTLVIGDAIYLQPATGPRFLALYTVVTPAKGAVLLTHGPGLHPDHGVTGQLRVFLSDRGYTTLSLQMPVLPSDSEAGDAYRALRPEAAMRIQAGVDFLGKAGFDRIAIVSHAMGSAMAHEFLRTHPAPPLFAWVALSFYGSFGDMAEAKFPIFDLYGANDYWGIRGTSSLQRVWTLRSVPGSKQLALAEGGYFLAGGEKAVMREVAAFLDAALKSRANADATPMSGRR